MHHCSFLFCIPDSRNLSLCFLSTIALFSHRIVSSVVWRKGLCPSPCKTRKYVFIQVQYQWYKPICFYLSINKAKEESLSSFLVDNLFSLVLSSIRTKPSYLLSVQSLPVHITTLRPFYFPYSSISSSHAL